MEISSVIKYFMYYVDHSHMNYNKSNNYYSDICVNLFTVAYILVALVAFRTHVNMMISNALTPTAVVKMSI